MLLVPIPWAGAHLGAAVPDRAGPLRAVRPGARPAPQDADRLGAPAAPASCGAGGRSAPSSPSPTAATPRWSCSPPAAAGPSRSRWSRACASTPRSTSPPRPGARGQRRPPAAEGPAPADAGRGRGRSSHALDPDHRRATGMATGERTVEVVSDTAVWYHTRAAAGAAALGADPRPARRVRHAGAALHRPRRRSRADPRLVRPALAAGGHLRGSAPAPRRRDAAPVVRGGDPPHHPGAARACSRSSPCSPTSSSPTRRRSRARPPGTTSRVPPSPMRWPWSGASSGGTRLFRTSSARTRHGKSPRAPLVERLTETLCYAA